MTHTQKRVVACIPYYRCPRYVRRAVEGLLAQTHPDLTVVVVNDADHQTPPWPALAGLPVPPGKRLVRFDLARNRGLYFANAVVLAATDAPYLLIQDADDWSHPQRVARLLDALETQRSDFAVSAEVQFQETAEGEAKILETHFQERLSSPNRTSADLKVLSTCLDPSYRYRICHHALFRTRALSDLGGYYAGFRLHFDKLLTNLLLMTGKVSHTPERLYWRLHWPGAQTQRCDTGLSSAASHLAQQQQSQMYQWAYARYQEFLGGQRDAADLVACLRRLCEENVPPDDRRALEEETSRLRRLLKPPV